MKYLYFLLALALPVIARSQELQGQPIVFKSLQIKCADDDPNRQFRIDRKVPVKVGYCYSKAPEVALPHKIVVDKIFGADYYYAHTERDKLDLYQEEKDGTITETVDKVCDKIAEHQYTTPVLGAMLKCSFKFYKPACIKEITYKISKTSVCD